MYIYNPKRKSKAHIVLPICFIAMGTVALAAAKVGVIPPFVMQMLAIVCIALAIHVISRYSLTDHTYEADSEKRVLNIRRLTGKKISLVASIEYGDIVAIDKKDKDYSLKEKYNKVYKVHNFCNNVFATEAYCLVCNIADEDIAVIIEADEMLLDILKRR